MAKILLIEDDELLRQVLAKALAGGGHEVIEAPDGNQGHQLALLNQPDLVITDLIMPGKEGIETIVGLRRELPRLPIIAMSGGAAHTKLYLDIAGKIGARRVLAKPFTPAVLMQAVNEVLAEKSP